MIDINDINDFFFDEKNTANSKAIDRMEKILPKCEIFPIPKIKKNSEKEEKSKINKKIK